MLGYLSGAVRVAVEVAVKFVPSFGLKSIEIQHYGLQLQVPFTVCHKTRVKPS